MPQRDKNVYTGRTLTLKSLHERGAGAAQALAAQNIADMLTIIEYNESVGIRFWRISSSMFPHLDNPEGVKYTMDFAREGLAAAGLRARQLGHRITMHPGQFAQLGSPTPDVVARTVTDLTNHARVFEYMGLTPERGSVMIIHGGGAYGDKAAALARWEQSFRALPREVSRFIVLENDEFTYGIDDLLPFCERIGVPLCIDFFHHQVMTERGGKAAPVAREMLERSAAIWRKRGIQPKFHWSNQDPTARVGTHGKCIGPIPREILDACLACGADLMIEAKDKDTCVLGVLRDQFRSVTSSGRIEWYLH